MVVKFTGGSTTKIGMLNLCPKSAPHPNPALHPPAVALPAPFAPHSVRTKVLIRIRGTSLQDPAADELSNGGFGLSGGVVSSRESQRKVLRCGFFFYFCHDNSDSFVPIGSAPFATSYIRVFEDFNFRNVDAGMGYSCMEFEYVAVGKRWAESFELGKNYLILPEFTARNLNASHDGGNN
ncbi:hypothetical protein R3P38DRAFT_2790776 [Favolaschia claudopus]|uniref:Uncharacterized protein n=1 Tax=Favolaschia claudopus TaxID=2862362 RepID=A0AAW0AKG8_9AGAR